MKRTIDTGRPVRPSPFFWWVRALLAAGGAVTIFPIVFAVVIRLVG